MPAPATTEDFLDLVRKSGLVDDERLAGACGRAGPAAAPPTPQAWAERLIDAGLVTRFQAEQLLQGKWRGFTIGKYKVLERIGAGGMGSVYLCEHQVVKRRVAIKVLPTAKAANPAALGRFYREARAAGVLDHPNLVKCHDIDRDGALHFLVMDYVDGANLQELVARSGALHPVRAAHYIAQTALGLQHAHDAGLVHRDIKPANILVDRGGTVRVLDLGLARFFTDQTDPLTLKYDESSVLGTADYVAPEQAVDSHEVDIRADIYSLGATFYFCLAGRPPFPGGRAAQKLIWHQVRHPTPVRQVRPEVPDGMAAVLARMMEKHPDARYQTPAEVAAALAPWTAEPLPPPTDAEMPRLCPAVLSGSSNGSGSGRTPPAGVRPAPLAGVLPPTPAPPTRLAAAGAPAAVAAAPAPRPSAVTPSPAPARALPPGAVTTAARPRVKASAVKPAARPAGPARWIPAPWRDRLAAAATAAPALVPRTRAARIAVVLVAGAVVGLILRFGFARPAAPAAPPAEPALSSPAPADAPR
jgi:serine/threonine protein kinase